MGTTIGFDLDMTLVDTRPGFRACLAATAEQLGDAVRVPLPLDELVEHLGPPLETMLAPYLDPAAVPDAVALFRGLYPAHAVTPVPAMPGAHEVLAAVHERGGRVLVVTGKVARNARLHLEHLGLDVDELRGGVWGVGKADALREHEALAYVGDHVHDVEGARAAGALSVSVTTGGSTAEELRTAGTDVVLPGLADVAAWLDGRWPAGQPARPPATMT